jgi:hypothetical protein
MQIIQSQHGVKEEEKPVDASNGPYNASKREGKRKQDRENA